MNNMISVQRAVLQAIEDIGVEEYDHLILQRWATDAEKSINGKYQFKLVRKVLDIKDSRFASLPCETFDVVRVLMGEDSNDYSGMWSYDPGLTITQFESSANLTPIVVSGYPTNSIYNYHVINNQISFLEDIVGHTKLTVYVMVYQIDKDGFILVSENHLEAISYYIKKMVAERSRFTPLKMTENDVRYFQSQWAQKKSVARSKSSKMTEAERSALYEFINNPLSGKACSYARV